MSKFKRTRVEPSSSSPNPDPRGPCGAKLDQPSFRIDELALFTSSTTEVFQWTRRLPPGAASRFVEATAADMHPGCGTFTSRTPYKSPQINQFLGAIRLPEVGDERVAAALRVWVQNVSLSWAYASEALVRRGDYLTAIAVVSAERPSAAFVRGLTIIAASRLEKVPTSS